MTPRLVGQAIRFPSSGRLDDVSSGVGSSEVELRAGVSFSPIDAWRGHLLGRVAAADCREHDAGQSIQRALSRETQQAELAARRAEANYLTVHRHEWRELRLRADAEMKAGLVTLVEMYELYRLIEELERKLLHAEIDAARLQAEESGRETEPAQASARAYLDGAMSLERELADLRALDAWTVKLTGGIVPLSGDNGRVEWFGFAELSYSLGGLFRGAPEARYLRAREAELHQESYELPARLGLLRRLVVAELASSRRALDHAEAELEFVAETLQKLEVGDAPGSLRGRARLTLERITVESETVMLRSRHRELTRLLEKLSES